MERLLLCSVCENGLIHSDHFCNADKFTVGRGIHSGCKKGFVSLSDSLRHKCAHSTEKIYNYIDCEKCLTTYGQLARHQSVHTDEGPFKCSQCEAGFKNSSELKLYQRTNTGEKLFTCSLCQKKKKTQSSYFWS
ncbi:gastrula zinc finger protein XlCGF71.1-like [Rhincodon typus]|uniref:gastrula zinc finger protein XlCGF71.1-like n=1 Tax=Rhincodon typus TaxID=259920 RepID=UPI00202FF06B|nr:gastrula zinc finger protein XlCGF71.1-like [Rhincodon typus]